MNTLYCAECHNALGPDECPVCGWQTPAKRGERAMRSLRVYKKAMAAKDPHPEDVRCAIGDLICDLHHLADTIEADYGEPPMPADMDLNEYRWATILDSADLHYEAEKGEKALTDLDLAERGSDREDARRMRGA